MGPARGQPGAGGPDVRLASLARGAAVGGAVRAALRLAWFGAFARDLCVGPHAVVVGAGPTAAAILTTCLLGEGVPAAAGLLWALRPAEHWEAGAVAGAAAGLGMTLFTAAGTALSLWADGEHPRGACLRASLLGPDALGAVPCAAGALLALARARAPRAGAPRVAGPVALALACAALAHATSAYLVSWRAHLPG